MRSVERTIEVEAPVDEAFARVAAFETSAQWDPGVAAAERLDEGAPEVGTRFSIQATFMGQKLPMTYTIVGLEPGRRLVLEGRAPGSSVRDTIEFEPRGTGTRIRWRLDLQLHGVRRLGSPFMGPLLGRLADVAMQGLEQDLNQT